MSDLRVYYLLNESSINCIYTVMEKRLRKWSNDWLSNDVCIAVTNVEMFSNESQLIAENAKMSPYLSFNDGRWCAFVYESHNWEKISNLLLAINTNIPLYDAANAGLIDDVITEAITDLSNVLLGANSALDINSKLDKSVTDFPEAAYLPGSGCFVMEITIGDFDCKLLLSAATVEKCLNVSVPQKHNNQLSLSSVDQSFERQLMTCAVGLGGAELSLEELVTLQVGDVLKLNHPIDELLTLKFNNSSLSIDGYLGKSDNLKSFKVKSVNYTE